MNPFLRNLFSNRRLLLLIGIIALYLVPIAFFSKYWIFRMAIMAIYAIAIMGLNVLYGRAGLLSIGQAAFVGLGAYFVALNQMYWGIPIIAEFIYVILIAVIAGLIVGLPAVRIRGVRLVVLTLSFQLVFTWALTFFNKYTNGQSGLFISSLSIGPFSTQSKEVCYVMALTFALLGALVMSRILKTPLGKSLDAIRQSEILAVSVGIDPVKTKLVAFIICSIYASVAGWLFAHIYGIAVPDFFEMFDSIDFLSGMFIGGCGSVLGCWLGAVYLIIFPTLVQGIGSGNLYNVLNGFLLMLVIILMPAGIVGTLKKFIANRTRNIKEVQRSRKQALKKEDENGGDLNE